MITLFGRIRKSLIGSDRGRKYFFYAIGEILLVVVGILIALQVNNWNEGNKRDLFRKSVLADLKTDLAMDTLLLNRQVERIDGILKSTVILDGLPAYHDSLVGHLGSVEGGIMFTPQNASYETLKSVGFDLIEDSQLRSAIIGLYRTYSWQNTIVERSQEEFFNHVWIPFSRDHFTHGYREDRPFQNMIRPRNYSDLLTNESYHDLLKWKMAWWENSNRDILS